MAKQIINELEAENKENARFFFSQKLITQQDETKDLHTTVEKLQTGTKDEKKSIEQKPTTYMEKIITTVKTFMELMTFANGRKSIPNPNANGKQCLWRGKKPFIPNDLPNGEHSQQRHPENNNSYCCTCGFNLPPIHTSKNCLYKKKNHKEEATIKNRMGGITTKCFHHPN